MIGDIDYVNLLCFIDKLPPGMLEHLPSEARYDEAAASIRWLADEAGVGFR
jgi:hypothetical protein